jgi:hypothetical protein
MHSNKRAFSWRNLSAFPASVGPAVAELLDSVQELLPPDDQGSRESSFDQWLANAARCGLISSRERDAAGEEVRLTLHERPEPLYLAMFANGDDDLLYEEAARDRYSEAVAMLPEKGAPIRLADDRSYVVVEPTTKRTGVVVASNLLRRGAQVRCRVNWPFAARPRNSWSPSTLVSPKTLSVTGAAARRVA